jgi:hypothetical protein
MIGYPFIEELFRNVLAKSRAIEGRFHVCPKFGMEINSESLGELIKDLVVPASGPKDPLSLMLPPVSRGEYTDKNGNWERYNIKQFFLKRSFNDSGGKVSYPNPNTQTSTHTILQDWHDMKRCSVNFLRMVDLVTKKHGLINKFRLEKTDRIHQPVSTVGNDRYSGVMVMFDVAVFIGCTLEDYGPQDVNAITIPDDDSHPEHKM